MDPHSTSKTYVLIAKILALFLRHSQKPWFTVRLFDIISRFRKLYIKLCIKTLWKQYIFQKIIITNLTVEKVVFWYIFWQNTFVAGEFFPTRGDNSYLIFSHQIKPRSYPGKRGHVVTRQSILSAMIYKLFQEIMRSICDFLDKM